MFESAAAAGEDAAVAEATGVVVEFAALVAVWEVDCVAVLVAPHALKARTIAPTRA
jgi:hypothetical protein